MKKRKIIITGKNYAFILGFIRAFKNIDYEIIVLNTTNKITKGITSKIKSFLKGKQVDECSKYVSEYHFVGNNKDRIIEYVNKYSDEDQKPFIIPTDDYTLSIFDSSYDLLSQKFYIPNIRQKSGEINNILDKKNQKAIAKKCGLNVAKSYDFNNLSEDVKIDFPVFVKPETSFKGNKHDMAKCNNKNELKSFIEKHSHDKDCPLLIEQFLNIENEYGILGCSYDGKIYIPGMIKKIKVGKGAQEGVTLIGETMEFNQNSELYDKIHKFISELNFSGLFDIEVFKANGEYYFSEINLRFGVYGYALTKVGTNIPMAYINMVLEKNINYKTDVKKQIFINERVCLENFKEGLISFKEYRRNIKSVDFCFTKDIDDMKPYYSFKKQELIQLVKKILKTVKK